MFKVTKRFNQKGFTLVELLVVIAIIGILATILLLQLGTARGKARDAKRISDLNQISSALELYYNDVGNYPEATDLTSSLVPKYIARIPSDPLTAGCGADYDGSAGCYGYSYTTGGLKYHVWAELEQDTKGLDSDSDNNSTGWNGAVKDLSATEACANDDLTDTECTFDLSQ